MVRRYYPDEERMDPSDARRIAKGSQANRSSRSRSNDGGRAAKVVFPSNPTPKMMEAYLANQGRADMVGIDAPKGTKSNVMLESERPKRKAPAKKPTKKAPAKTPAKKPSKPTAKKSVEKKPEPKPKKKTSSKPPAKKPTKKTPAKKSVEKKPDTRSNPPMIDSNYYDWGPSIYLETVEMHGPIYISRIIDRNGRDYFGRPAFLVTNGSDVYIRPGDDIESRIVDTLAQARAKAEAMLNPTDYDGKLQEAITTLWHLTETDDYKVEMIEDRPMFIFSTLDMGNEYFLEDFAYCTFSGVGNDIMVDIWTFMEKEMGYMPPGVSPNRRPRRRR